MIPMNKKQKKTLLRIIITAIALIALNIIAMPDYVKFAAFLATYLCIGHDILKKAWHGIANRKVFSESFLMAVATLGVFALAFLEHSSDYNEAITVMLFYQIGELFQSCAVSKSRKSISDIMDIRPDYANIETDGSLKKVDPEEVAVDSIIIIQPGERIPLDGTIVEGSSSLNTSAITGESIPRDVDAGDDVLSGCINLNGVLRVRTTKIFEESTASRILELVENAGSLKSRSEKFISRFAGIYTPVVCYLALFLAIIPPVAGYILGGSLDFLTWIYRALIFLVISCPCALVISIPLSFFAGIGGASRNGILVKGSNYLESMSKVRTIVFDKTGTLTMGVFEVSGIHHSPMEDERILEYAALAECASSHPISQSLKNAYAKEIIRDRVKDIQELSGYGVTARVDNDVVAVGNSKLMKKLNISYRECHGTGTVVHIAINGEYAGHILISDQLKPHSKEAIQSLKSRGVEKIIMLTGDIKKVASDVASTIGVDEYISDLLPADKVFWVEKLLASKPKGSMVAFVGDGINDAPVLTRADIGIAMGAMGSDAAIEAADIVLMNDDPLLIPKAIKISQKCMSIVYQNIAFALVVKFSCLLLGALGLANMWAAIFADVGVMVLAVLNSIRMLADN